MAVRGSKKARADNHEIWIADQYSGMPTANSGATDHAKGDVRTPAELIECKCTGEPGKPSKSTLVKEFEIIADQAWERGTEPMMALRFFMPDSTLAARDGWVDLAVRLVRDDAIRAGVVDWNKL